ncbi:MAG: ZIP family metal transporter [Gammaproteobacteria bacterium]
MLSAFIWAFVAASSLLVGGVIGSFFNLSRRMLGIIMAFGAGVLISAVAYELVFEAIQSAKQTGYPAFGFFLGAAVFFIADNLIGKMGGEGRKSINASHASSLVIPLMLGIILDGIPESVVIGLGILEGGSVSIGMLVAVFISNIPEAVAGTTGMRSGGWGRAKILGLWFFIALVCAAFSALGYAVMGDVPETWLALVNAFAAGAILMMLANTMIPEAYEHGGKLAGVFTVLGFATAVYVTVLERSL